MEKLSSPVIQMADDCGYDLSVDHPARMRRWHALQKKHPWGAFFMSATIWGGWGCIRWRR